MSNQSQQMEQWQVVVGEVLPAIDELSHQFSSLPELDSEPYETGEQPERESLNGRVWYLLFSTFNELICVFATGNPIAFANLSIRAGLTGFTAMTGFFAGSSRGFLSALSRLSAFALMVYQGISLFGLLAEAYQNPAVLGPLVVQLFKGLLAGQLPQITGDIVEILALLHGSWMLLLTQGFSFIAAFRILRAK
ncbi:MAG: hypothetical protein KKB51_16480 [Candidatus Riflebacteria bacterium]|nr:hypothetical protein [Candidatus Riflebacteria bacterium]